MKYTLKQLLLTGKYNFIKDEESLNVHTVQPCEIQKKQDAILDVIFAPDPFTGYPRSDLQLLMSEKTRPEIQNYIKNFLCQPFELPQGTDKDISLETLQTRDMVGRRYDEYVKGLQQYLLDNNSVSSSEN